MTSSLAVISAVCVAVIRTLPSYTIRYSSTANLGLLLSDVYGGLPWDQFITFGIMAGWLLAMLPGLIGMVTYMQRELGEHMVLSVHRYHSLRSWWLGKLAGSMLFALGITAVSCAASLITGFMLGLRSFQMFVADADGFLSPALWLVFVSPLCCFLQLWMLLQFQMLAHLIFRDVRISVIAFLLPLILGILSMSNDEDPSHIWGLMNWGMTKRYAIAGSFGVDPFTGVLLQLAVITVWMILGLVLIKRLKTTECKPV
jgi:hypothetical protein